VSSIYSLLHEIESRGDRAVLCTVLRTIGSVPRHVGSKMIVLVDGSIYGSIGGGEMEKRVSAAAVEVLKQDQPQVLAFRLQHPKEGDPGVCGGEVEIFLEPVRPTPTLLVIGGGHVGRAVVYLGKLMGYRVILSDDREEYCNADEAPGADLYLMVPMRELPQHLRFTTETFIVLPTRGMSLDVAGLPKLLEQPHGYIGVIGSRRRWRTTHDELLKLGVSREVLDTIHSPMGLDIEAETPMEIAVSVLAEITMLRNGGTGKTMKSDI
jgi:xanthine dehydrogenase accessory factor